MGMEDQDLFKKAVAKAKAGGRINFFGDPYASGSSWIEALNACNVLAMFDILPAIQAISPSGGKDVEFITAVESNRIGVDRIKFACTVVWNHEIINRGLPLGQVNDGREFLGCTRLDDSLVRQTIADTLRGASPGADKCCGTFQDAWEKLARRRQVPGASLDSNLAAAAHYMLARYNVCAANASVSQMKIVIDEYDNKKRSAFANGDRDLRSIALTPNLPFPVDFAIRNWGNKGADDGEIDRQRCNSSATVPLWPDVAGQPSLP